MSNPNAGRNSPHLRNYGGRISIHAGKITSMPPDKEALRLIAIIDEYVVNDDGPKGSELCWIIHEEGKVCVKVEGHKG